MSAVLLAQAVAFTSRPGIAFKPNRMAWARIGSLPIRLRLLAIREPFRCGSQRQSDGAEWDAQDRERQGDPTQDLSRPA